MLLIPISLIWVVLFFGPLLGLSYIYDRITIARPIISIIGIPVAVTGNIYIAIMPSMGEWDSRFAKMVICQTFPYTWRFIELERGKDVIEQNDELTKVLREVSGAKPLDTYLKNLRIDVVSRPCYLKKNYILDW